MEQIKKENQVAYVFTKWLDALKFAEFRKQLGMTTPTKFRESWCWGEVLGYNNNSISTL